MTEIERIKEMVDGELKKMLIEKQTEQEKIRKEIILAPKGTSRLCECGCGQILTNYIRGHRQKKEKTRLATLEYERLNSLPEEEFNKLHPADKWMVWKRSASIGLISDLKEIYYPKGDFDEIVNKGNKFFADWKRFRDTNLIQSDQHTKDIFERYRGFYLEYLKPSIPVNKKGDF